MDIPNIVEYVNPVKKHTIEQTFELIDRLTDEYIGASGYVTCEFSTSEEKVAAILKYVSKVNVRFDVDPNLANAHWCVTYCDVCEKHNKNFPYHVKIYCPKS